MLDNDITFEKFATRHLTPDRAGQENGALIKKILPDVTDKFNAWREKNKKKLITNLVTSSQNIPNNAPSTNNLLLQQK